MRARYDYVAQHPAEAPVTAEPGNGETPAAAAGRGHLRASHADREQVIAMLKAAFVQGRLTKDELDARAGQTFAARTYTELAAITADLPAGLITAPPPRKSPPVRARPPAAPVVAGAVLILPPPVILAAAYLTGSDQLAKVFLLIVPWFFLAWIVAAGQMLANRHDKRSQGQPPPRRGQRGRALEGGQGGGTGGDLMLCQARRDGRDRHRPGRGAIRHSSRSMPACLQVTA
jgi:uncharacterized protein DUF1707